MLKMPEKEEFGYGMIVVFVLASLFLIVLMLPFDTITGAAVLDYSSEEIENLIYSAPFVNFIILIAVSILIVGGSLDIIKQRKEAEDTLKKIPRMNRVELREFARESLDKGFKKEDIRDALINGGWGEDTVEAVLKLY